MNGDVFFGCVIGALLMAAITTAVPFGTSVSTDLIDIADQKCEDNGGLEALRIRWAYDDEALCANGAVFKLEERGS